MAAGFALVFLTVEFDLHYLGGRNYSFCDQVRREIRALARSLI